MLPLVVIREVRVSLIPCRLAELAGPVADVFAIHLLQGLGHVQAVQEAHKTKALGLFGALVLDNLQRNRAAVFCVAMQEAERNVRKTRGATDERSWSRWIMSLFNEF